MSFRKSTPPQHRQLNIFISNIENNILISNRKQQVDDFVRELTF